MAASRNEEKKEIRTNHGILIWPKRTGLFIITDHGLNPHNFPEYLQNIETAVGYDKITAMDKAMHVACLLGLSMVKQMHDTRQNLLGALVTEDIRNNIAPPNHLSNWNPNCSIVVDAIRYHHYDIAYFLVERGYPFQKRKLLEYFFEKLFEIKSIDQLSNEIMKFLRFLLNLAGDVIFQWEGYYDNVFHLFLKIADYLPEKLAIDIATTLLQHKTNLNEVSPFLRPEGLVLTKLLQMKPTRIGSRLLSLCVELGADLTQEYPVNSYERLTPLHAALKVRAEALTYVPNAELEPRILEFMCMIEKKNLAMEAFNLKCLELAIRIGNLNIIKKMLPYLTQDQEMFNLGMQSPHAEVVFLFLKLQYPHPIDINQAFTYSHLPKNPPHFASPEPAKYIGTSLNLIVTSPELSAKEIGLIVTELLHRGTDLQKALTYAATPDRAAEAKSLRHFEVTQSKIGFSIFKTSMRRSEVREHAPLKIAGIQEIIESFLDPKKAAKARALAEAKAHPVDPIEMVEAPPPASAAEINAHDETEIEEPPKKKRRCCGWF